MAMRSRGSSVRSAERGCDFWQLDGAGEAVKQAHAKEEEAGGHASEEEVFERCFGGEAALLVEAGEDVERKREEFEGDENEKQVLRGDQEHHGHGGEEDEREVFADVAGDAGGGREQDRENREAEQRALDELRQRGEDEHATRQGSCAGMAQQEERDQAANAGDEGCDAETLRERGAAQEGEIECEQEQARDGYGQFRQGAAEEFGVTDHRHAPWRRPSKSGELSAGRIRSIRIRG